MVCQPLQLAGQLLEGRDCVRIIFVSLVKFSQNRTLGCRCIARDSLGKYSEEKTDSKGMGKQDRERKVAKDEISDQV